MGLTPVFVALVEPFHRETSIRCARVVLWCRDHSRCRAGRWRDTVGDANRDRSRNPFRASSPRCSPYSTRSSFTMRDAITVTGLEMVVGAVGLAFVSPHVWPSRQDAVLILVLAVGCTLVPYVLSLVALRHMSAFSAVAGREYGTGVRDRAGNPVAGRTARADPRVLRGSGDHHGRRVQPPAIESWVSTDDERQLVTGRWQFARSFAHLKAVGLRRCRG